MPERRTDMPFLTDDVAAIDGCAANIEQAFLAAGHGLGAGLATIEELSQALAGFLAEFQSGRMAAASTALDQLSQRLVEVAGSLPRDTAALQAVATGNDAIGKHLEELIEQIRMMSIIASSARIEAAVFPEAAGLASFTTEMSALTDAVRTSVGRCERDHAAMTERVRRLVMAQSALDRDFHDKLLTVSRELAEIFDLVTARQLRACELTEALAGRSAQLAGSAGTALVALQGGDAARQRLEHIAEALRLADRLVSDKALEAVPPGLLPLLCRLQAAQLDDLVGSFSGEAQALDAMLGRVSDDAGELAASGRGLLGADDGSGSFLARFDARLDEAAGLTATCTQARADVARAMEALRADVEGLRSTVADLGTTTLDLIMVGINAGLRATRLGTDGRSLMVIADELKRLAGVITEGASRLVAAYEELDGTSRALDRAGETPAPDADEAGATIAAVLATFADADGRMTDFVETLQARAETFEAEIRGTHQVFCDTAEAVAALGAVVDRLETGDGPGPDAAAASPGDVVAVLEARLWPHYTMTRERDIHVAVVGAGPGTPEGVTVPGPHQYQDLDDVLFTDAA